ncbi:ABC transporter transmembrane region [Plasmodiophora brassicae]|uniref:Uncharacterized protein n=1 Tax=Plasmodiophora brassicae TaxID=37360 RepID=A0A3P3YBM9_PLABS|nr:unnamed protein product [Plasmodiophora brassicae]
MGNLSGWHSPTRTGDVPLAARHTRPGCRRTHCARTMVRPDDVDVEMGVQPKVVPDGESSMSTGDDVPRVTLIQMFEFTTPLEVCVLVLGAIGGIVNGLSLPAFSILFGNLFQSFGGGLSSQQFYDKVSEICVQFVYVGLVAFAASWLQVSCWALVADRQALHIRKTYLQSLLRQECAWFDTQEPGKLSTRLGADITQVRDAMGQNIGNCFQFGFMFIGGLAVGLYKGWELTLVVLASVPLLAIAGAAFAKALSKDNTKAMDAFAVAGAVSEEVLRSIRTVTIFRSQEREVERFAGNLHLASETGIRKGRIVGASIGAMWASMLIAYGSALWYGGHLIASGKYEQGTVMTVFFSVVTGASGLGQIGPSVTAITTGLSVAPGVWSVMRRKSKIDALSESPAKTTLPSPIRGEIRFENVHFSYPGRRHHKVLSGFNLVIPAGSTAALVGETGSGKSTVGQLLTRFYDPDEGRITIDGIDIRDVSVSELRRHIGVVFQQPTLFAGTIRENIAYGRGCTMEQVEAAARVAHCHDFIVNDLPEKYDTDVGGSGNERLSGGQKQRIAIARAIANKPPILLQDEATSALDSHSERLVQQALQEAASGTTAIVIAHRLSTIRDANLICVLKNGSVAEMGNHNELSAKDGIYSRMLKSHGGTDSDAAAKADGEQDAQLPGPHLEQGPARAVSDGKEVSRKAEAGDEKEVKARISSLTSKLWDKSRSDWPFIALGVFGSIGMGLVMPSFSFILSEMMKAFFQPDVEAGARKWAFVFFGLAAYQMVSSVIATSNFAIVGERLTYKLRVDLFRAFLRQDVSWFDHPDNAPGILNIKLSNDCERVRGLTVGSMSTLVQVITMLVVGLGIAFYYGWRLALVLLATGPILAIAGAAQLALIVDNKQKAAFEFAGRIANEACGAIRTVASLTAERQVIADFDAKLRPVTASARLQAIAAGAAFGMSQFVMFSVYCVAFYYGAWLVKEGLMNTPIDLFKVFFAIVLSMMGVGQVMQMAPDGAKARQAAVDIFNFLEMCPVVDPTDTKSGQKMSLHGQSITFDNVDFSYPTRPDSTVLDKLRLQCPAGKTLALVGPSGSGKSSTVALIARFYEPSAGSVRIGDVPLTALNVVDFRRQIGLVSQEPVLFSGSIRDNIAYGRPSATTEEIQEAARQANASEFIDRLPDGLQTLVGTRGSQLSGGQRQRIAIARALLIDPQLLLLDEATSALDNESEALVQAALDTLMKGRTSIVIAHRLSTIKNADVIVVMEKGRVIEQGTHAELVAAGGTYSHLHALQH